MGALVSAQYAAVRENCRGIETTRFVAVSAHQTELCHHINIIEYVCK